MNVTANVFDPVEDHLDQAVFNGTDLRNSVQKFVARTYFRALDRYLGVIGTEWADLYLTGSLTTYQYSETSDADHSVFPDYDRIWQHLGIDPDTCRKQLIEMSITDLDGIFVPGTMHPIQYFVVPYGTMPHDVFKPGLRSAWSYFDHMWFVPPDKHRVHNVAEEYPQVYARAAAIAEKMSQMLDAGNFDTAKELWHNVHKKRQLDQRAGLGDFSEGNITLKWLLHEGLIDRLRNEAGLVIQTKVGAWEDNRWIGSEAELFHILDVMTDNTPWMKYTDPQSAQKLIGFMETGLGFPMDEAQQFYAAYVQYRQEKEIEDKKRREEYEKRRVEWEAQMEQAKLETDKWYKELDAQYGEATDKILHRFDSLKPEDAPPFSADRETAIQYAAEQGWEWKFIISKGHGAWVWADGETHDYNGLYPHSEAMVDLRNETDMPKPNNQTMALGWIEKPPLEDGDEPYRVLVRGGDGWSDEEILQQLGLEGDGYVDRSSTPMRLEWYGASTKTTTLFNPLDPSRFKENGAFIYFSDTDELLTGTSHPGILRNTLDKIKQWQISREEWLVQQKARHPLLGWVYEDLLDGSLKVEFASDLYQEMNIGDKAKALHKIQENTDKRVEEAKDTDYGATTPIVRKSWSKSYRISALPHLWEDRVTTKVIYDFDEDRIVLGTQATLPDLASDSKIVGEYTNGNVTLYEADKQWINPTYFRRLWHFSYPHRKLNDIFFRRDAGDEYKLKSLPRRRKIDA